MKKAFCLACAAVILPGIAFAQEMIRREMPTGILPAEVLRPVIEKAKSKEGRYVLLPNKQRVLVIDVPKNWFAVEAAIMKIDPANLEVALEFAFRTAVPPITKIKEAPSPFDDLRTGDVAVPTQYHPPYIIPNGNGFYTVIPATPTRFVRRSFGDSLTADAFALERLKSEQSGETRPDDFEGYVANAAGMFKGGKTGVQPVLSQVAKPEYFEPYLKKAGVKSASVIGTQMLVKPVISPTGIVLELTPQLLIDGERKVTLSQFRTVATLDGVQPAIFEGFEGADAEFNQHFFDELGEAGGTLVHVRGKLVGS